MDIQRHLCIGTRVVPILQARQQNQIQKRAWRSSLQEHLGFDSRSLRAGSLVSRFLACVCLCAFAVRQSVCARSVSDLAAASPFPPQTHTQPASQAMLPRYSGTEQPSEAITRISLLEPWTAANVFEQLAMATGIVLIDTILHLRSNPKRSLQWYRVSTSCRVTLVHWRADLRSERAKNIGEKPR